MSRVAKDCKGSLRCLTYLDRGGKDVGHAAGSSSSPVFRKALKCEVRDMRFLQFNLGRGRDAQNLRMQVARERRADVLLISEQ